MECCALGGSSALYWFRFEFNRSRVSMKEEEEACECILAIIMIVEAMHYSNGTRQQKQKGQYRIYMEKHKLNLNLCPLAESLYSSVAALPLGEGRLGWRMLMEVWA